MHPKRLLLALIFPLLVCFLSGCGGTGKQQGLVFALEFVFSEVNRHQPKKVLEAAFLG
ncbi:hypothetical protein EDD75_0248 [Thermodesulfitimonas autotrophica]|uniref:Uncharacterized protein n=1 Tax=Thermodesulfitimonas autotrophica TaxID=1894989 RepID=A0A3N5AW32_9THEO|nr:hypothetical protein [Thermodesulfitimonas autotrophica]RPF49436.1 hypothetical protein EDD75_0248 [Thermodesulfitimonas autotrophica]